MIKPAASFRPASGRHRAGRPVITETAQQRLSAKVKFVWVDGPVRFNHGATAVSHPQHRFPAISESGPMKTAIIPSDRIISLQPRSSCVSVPSQHALIRYGAACGAIDSRPPIWPFGPTRWFRDARERRWMKRERGARPNPTLQSIGRKPLTRGCPRNCQRRVTASMPLLVLFLRPHASRDARRGKAGRNVRAASQETCQRVSPISRTGRAEERMIVAATTQKSWRSVVRPLRKRITAR